MTLIMSFTNILRLGIKTMNSEQLSMNNEQRARSEKE